MRNLLVLAALMVMLVAALAFAWFGWTGIADVAMPAAGYGALIAGVIGALVVGCGLMALIFYSHRHGYDEQVKRDDERRR